MAIAYYDNFKNNVAGGGNHAVTDFSADTIEIRLLRTADYTFSAAHEDEADLHAGVTDEVMAIDGAVGAVAAGVVDFADTVFDDGGGGVPAGAAIDCAVIFNTTSGVAATNNLILYIDGFTVTPNGDDITFVWPAGGVLDFG